MEKNGLRGIIFRHEKIYPMIDIRCRRCRRPYPENEVPFLCEICGGIFDVDALPSYRKIKQNQFFSGIWRYRNLFGLPDLTPEISLGEGNTPLIWVNIFENRVALKAEYINPTGSFKDRGSAVLVSYLKALGIDSAVEDSSGNAGASFAAYAAHSGIETRIYVPESTSGPKINQIKAYGAKVVRIRGPRINAANAVKKAAESGDIYASHAYLPHGIIGYATIAYELWEQLGTLPGTILCPVGQGNLLLGIGRGFDSIRRAGLISKLPKLVGVQARACAPMWALSNNGDVGSGIVSEEKTVAEGICINTPIRSDVLLEFIEENNGLFVSVDENRIINGYEQLARLGFYVEPTSAVVYAALEQVVGNVPEPIVLILTGSGLKTSVVS
jgi:threonine synthase